MCVPPYCIISPHFLSLPVPPGGLNDTPSAQNLENSKAPPRGTVTPTGDSMAVRGCAVRYYLTVTLRIGCGVPCPSLDNGGAVYYFCIIRVHCGLMYLSAPFTLHTHTSSHGSLPFSQKILAHMRSSSSFFPSFTRSLSDTLAFCHFLSLSFLSVSVQFLSFKMNQRSEKQPLR